MTQTPEKKMALYHKNFDMGSITQCCHNMFRVLTEEKKLSCMWVGRMEGAYVGDEKRVCQMMLGIIGNMVPCDKSIMGIRIDVVKEEISEWRDLFTICFRNIEMDYGVAGDRCPQSKGRLGTVNCIVEAMGGSIRQTRAGNGSIITLKFALDRQI